MTSQMVQDRI